MLFDTSYIACFHVTFVSKINEKYLESKKVQKSTNVEEYFALAEVENVVQVRLIVSH